MLDRDRILTKLDQLDGYLSELRQVVPPEFDEYRSVTVRRASERLLQIAIECVVDICGLLVAGLRLGVPAEENDLFDKLAEAGVILAEMRERLRRMKGLRNLLVHEYGRIDDRRVWDLARGRLGDFEEFADAVRSALRRTP